MTKYTKLLKDPRWQKKRLEILERDEWKCVACGDKEETLHVHHKWYEKGIKPWDYKDKCLVTLCDSCHKFEHTISAISASGLIKAYLSNGFLYSDFPGIACSVCQKNTTETI